MRSSRSKARRQEAVEKAVQDRYREPVVGGRRRQLLSWKTTSAAVLVAALGVVALAYASPATTYAKAQKWLLTQSGTGFPDEVPAATTQQQVKFVDLVRREYNDQPAGTKYSRGVQEPWCADFVSWVRKELGQPLSNPHSGSWRIPGVWTLKEHAQTSGTFRSPGSGYQPKVGDVLIWGPESGWDRHVNFVLDVDGENVTTIGGNESDMIQVGRARPETDHGFHGYMVLEQSQ